MQSVSSVQKCGTHISYYGITCFAVYALGSEESFTMLNVPAESAVTPQEQQFLLEQLLHLSSSGITGQEAPRAIVRMFPDQQQKVKVSKAVRTLQDTMQNTEQHGSAAECPCVDRTKPMPTPTLGRCNSILQQSQGVILLFDGD